MALNNKQKNGLKTKQFFLQEGDATVTLNGESKVLCKDDVIIIPSGAKLVLAHFIYNCSLFCNSLSY